MKRKLLGGFLFLLLLIAALLYTLPLLQTGTGYAAKMMCSCSYVEQSEKSVENLQKERLNFSVLGHLSIHPEAATQTTLASLYGLAPARATFIAGRGCVVLADQAQALPAPITLPTPPRSETASDWPLKPDSTTRQGVDLTALVAALDYGMQAVEGGGAHAMVVLRAGKLLAERYAEGIHPDTRLLGWSMTKTLTAALLGIRVAEGKLDPDKKPLLAAWASEGATDPRAAIGLWDLLRMNSGLAWEEAYGSVTDATVMLYHQPDMAAYVARKPLAHPIGEHWVYSSGTTNLLMHILAETFPSNEALTAWMYERLFYPIGANSFLIEPDQSGLPVGSSYGWATARDWAKVGQLFLQQGQWNGQAVITADWVAEMLRPAKGSEGVYGGQIWLKGPDTPSLPEDAFMLRGFQDQRVIIVPSHQLVIVRLGHNKDKVSDFDTLIARLLEAVPPLQ